MIRSILKVGIPSGLENSMFQLGKLMVSRIFTGFGTAAIAANAISSSLGSIVYMPGQGFGMAILTIVGQCVGARNYDGAKRYTAKLMKLLYGILIPANMLLFISCRPLIGFFGLSQEALGMAVLFTSVHCISSSIAWPLSFALPNALRAAGDANFCMIVAAISMWSVRVSAAYLLAYPLGVGPLGVWLAMAGDFVVRSICYTWRWVHGRWQTKRVIS
jgi:Na+-driven multidrug efflux pump